MSNSWGKRRKKNSIEYTKKIKVNQPPFTLSNMFESAFLFKLHLGPRWRDENIFSSPDVSTVFQGCEASICTGSQKGLKHENELKYGTVTGDFRTLTLDGALFGVCPSSEIRIDKESLTGKPWSCSIGSPYLFFTHPYAVYDIIENIRCVCLSIIWRSRM